MATTSREAEVAEIDRFLAEDKSLGDPPPTWVDSHIPGWWSATWPIRDSLGIVQEGAALRFSCKKTDPTQMNIAVVKGGHRICALDLVPDHVTKPNPPDAHRLQLPATVSGSHFHTWADNRARALAVGLGEVPYRRPVPDKLRKLPHALAALAQAINLTLTPEHASFDVPPQGYLFEE